MHLVSNPLPLFNVLFNHFQVCVITIVATDGTGVGHGLLCARCSLESSVKFCYGFSEIR